MHNRGTKINIRLPFYTSTEMEDQIKNVNEIFFNLKLEMFKCSNSSKKMIPFYFFFASLAGELCTW